VIAELAATSVYGAFAVKSVAAVYGLAWIVTLAYVAILNAKFARLERQLDEIASLMEAAADA
jgi:hypothetical protein